MSDDIKLRWYVVNTYSGYEKKAKLSLQKRIETEELEQFFGDVETEILIPVETLEEVRKGEKKSSERKFFSGLHVHSYAFERRDMALGERYA